ncbi:hypothetical protein [Paenibacillus sp. N3.4]|uniref:hypothetical protein n=1 Tax=Paenibacillus sp. N3.4 TaxID=2603222 RepID=UPI0011CB006F|nr:hypothetical protein [Paenibacillus sp. N3.4]TXK82697.1 hypothetical protein FU659_14540 [Paenibacillus sp. N3.4]
MASLLPFWIELNYEIIVTSDHGMNMDGSHGGTGAAEREVPFYVIGASFEPGYHEDVIPQLAVAPLVCRLLSLPLEDDMAETDILAFTYKIAK